MTAITTTAETTEKKAATAIVTEMSTATASTTKTIEKLTRTTTETEVLTATEKPTTTAVTREVPTKTTTAAKTIEKLPTTTAATEVLTEAVMTLATDKVQTTMLTTEKLNTTETKKTLNTEKSEKPSATAVTTKKPVVTSVTTILGQNTIKPTERSGATITSDIFRTGATTTEKRNPTPRPKATTKPVVIQITTTEKNTNGKIAKPWTSQETAAAESTGSQNLQRITKIKKNSTTGGVDNTISGNNSYFA